MNEDLTNKRILFIAMSGYSVGMLKEMKRLGAEVDYINDKPNDGALCKVLGKLKSHIYSLVLNKYYEKELNTKKNKDYDYILVIKGDHTPPNTLLKIRSLYPNAKMILYMWDSMKNNKGIEKRWKYYDKVITFDRLDYLRNQDKIFFLPLFYYNEYIPKNMNDVNNFKYDVSFIGTAHEDRIKIVRMVKKQCDRLGLNMYAYLFLPHWIVFLKNKIFNPNYRNVSIKYINFKSLPFKDVYDIYSNSKCVMDVESLSQSGLTMRSIEMLGLKRKFITTNKDILNYDFYHPNNILVVDRNDFVIDEDFFKKPYVELEENIYKKYSLNNWLISLFSI